MTEIDDARRAILCDLLAGPNYAALTTLSADGTPRTHVMWVAGTPDRIEINTEIGRAKDRHMRNDPRVTVMIWDRDAPGRFVEVVGRVTGILGGAEAREHIDQLAHKYLGRPYDPDAIVTERVIFEITPTRLFACDVTTSEAAPGIWSA